MSLHVCECCHSLCDGRQCDICSSLDFSRAEAKPRVKRPKGFWPLKKRPQRLKVPWEGNVHRFPMMFMAHAEPGKGLTDVYPSHKVLGRQTMRDTGGPYLKGNKTPCRENMLEAIASKPGQKSITDYMSK